jgi:hypothetical protein
MTCHNNGIAAKDSLWLIVTVARFFETSAPTYVAPIIGGVGQGSGYVCMMFQR